LDDYGNSLTCADPPHLFGGYGEYVYALPGSYLIKVPEDVPVEIAVLTEVMSVTTSLDKAKQFSAVHTEGFRFGDTVVVQGVGPLGLCHVMKARMLGAGEIIVLDKSPLRLQLALEMGADTAIDIREIAEPKDRIAMIRDRTGGRGADVVVEAAGVPEAFTEGLQMLRAGGLCLEVGNFSDMGGASISPHVICSKNIRIAGVGGEAITAYGPSLEAFRRYRRHYPIHKIVTHRYPVEKAEEAMHCSMTDESVKVVIASSEYL
jgi:L-iditol 2-dehydrogenase